MGENHRFKFEDLLNTFHSATGMLNASADKIPVKVNQMLNVYRHEKFRFEKSEDENEPPQS